MLLFSQKNKPIVGLDIGTTAIRAVEIRPAGKGWRLHRWATRPLPSDSMVDGKVLNKEKVVATLTALFEQNDFSTRRVALSVGGPSVIIKNIQLPFMTELDLEDQISLEAEEHIPFGIDDVNLDFQILNREQEHINVLLTACKKEVLDGHLQAVAEAGLTAVVCDLDLCSLINSYDAFVSPLPVAVVEKKKKNSKQAAEKSAPPSVVCLVNSGGSYLNVAILIGSIPTFIRDHSFGTRQFVQQLSQELEIPFVEAEPLLQGGETEQQKELLAELLPTFEGQLQGAISQSIDLYKNTNPKNPVTEIAISGTCALIPGLDARLGKAIDIPTKISNPLTTLKEGKGNGYQPLPSSQAPRYIIALGLALRGDMP